VREIGDYAFSGAGLESIYFGLNSELRTIRQGVFNECKDLCSIAIPANVVVIEPFAFRESGLVSLLCAQNSRLVRIEEQVFVSCADLNDVELPLSVEIEDSAFDGCFQLNANLFESSSEYKRVTGWTEEKWWQFIGSSQDDHINAIIDQNIGNDGWNEGPDDDGISDRL